MPARLLRHDAGGAADRVPADRARHAGQREAAAEGTPERLRQKALALLAKWNGEENEHLPCPGDLGIWMADAPSAVLGGEVPAAALELRLEDNHPLVRQPDRPQSDEPALVAGVLGERVAFDPAHPEPEALVEAQVVDVGRRGGDEEPSGAALDRKSVV